MKSVIALIPIAAAVAGCSTLTPTDDPVYLRLTDLEARLMRIERVVNNESLIQLANRVEQLQAETQALRGEVETLRFETESSADRQRQLYLDIDQRLQALESQGRGGAPGGGFGGAQQGGFGGPQQGGFDGAAAGPGGDSGGGFPPVEFAGEESGDVSAAQFQVSGSDQENYQTAFDLIQARRYEDAGTAFSNFLQAFPDSPLADNAQYWLAETLYVRQQFSAALPEFQKVVDEYPQSAKIPDALLKVGYCNFELQQWDQARAALEQVAREYPDTTAARLAAQRLERIAQEAG
ncbi:MAG: tol-pal system protein YbgF [Gammaproteobacteria bacterium]|nr:tol-pal system protein YbgF [Gammaproteobacteria bacterium]